MKLAEKRIWEQEVGRLVEGLLKNPSDAENVKHQLVGKMVKSVRRNNGSKALFRRSEAELDDMWDNMPV